MTKKIEKLYVCAKICEHPTENEISASVAAGDSQWFGGALYIGTMGGNHEFAIPTPDGLRIVGLETRETDLDRLAALAVAAVDMHEGREVGEELRNTIRSARARHAEALHLEALR